MIIQKVLDIDYEAMADWAAHKVAVERYIMAHLDEKTRYFFTGTDASSSYRCTAARMALWKSSTSSR